MYSLTYKRVKSLDEAKQFIAANPDAKLMSGGMTLLPTLKQRLAQPSHVVDIGALGELKGIEVKADRLIVGAATRHFDVAGSALVKKAIPALAYLANLIGDPQVRNMGTMGGSIANNDPAADYPSAVLALNANVITTKREIAADNYFKGVFATALDASEIITKISFALPKRRERSHVARSNWNPSAARPGPKARAIPRFLSSSASKSARTKGKVDDDMLPNRASTCRDSARAPTGRSRPCSTASSTERPPAWIAQLSKAEGG